MKSKLFLLLSIVGIILLSSCEETVTFDDLHKTENEAAFTAIAGNNEYTKIESQSKAGFIMYKELVDGDGARPLFNDQVKVRYTGWYKIDWTKEDTYTDEEGKLIKNKKIFDTTAIADDVNIARTLKVATSINPYDGGIIDGFSTALQHMEVGDKWEVWIPWQLGYGSSASGTIPAYTTLVFEIELVSIVE